MSRPGSRNPIARLVGRLPTRATAPFCPSEVRGEVTVGSGLPGWRRALAFAGPGLLVSVGYMDPGNWATDIQAGSTFGYSLIWVVVAASLAAIVLQTLSARVGLATGRDLAQLCRDRYPPAAGLALFAFAEISIIACDVAEVLGAALAFKLLLHIPLMAGIALTALDTLVVLGLKGRGVRHLEAIVLGLVATIGACFAVELALVRPDLAAVARGLIPTPDSLAAPGALYLAIGIVGATVMPHNLYLHSSLVQTRRVEDGAAAAARLATFDLTASLLAALLVNAAILVLAAAAFHRPGAPAVAEIDEAWRLLQPIAGTAFAGVLFGVALLASGQSSTVTGTIAGQVVLQGFTRLDRPCWQVRLATRALALVPAVAGVAWLGDGGVGRLLVLTQVVLSLQLPFAMGPLIAMAGDGRLMGARAAGPAMLVPAWGLFALISAANAWLAWTVLRGG